MTRLPIRELLRGSVTVAVGGAAKEQVRIRSMRISVCGARRPQASPSRPANPVNENQIGVSGRKRDRAGVSPWLMEPASNSPRGFAVFRSRSVS
jgi:hypothetical protein